MLTGRHARPHKSLRVKSRCIKANMAVPWFYTSLDVCNSNSNNKLVIVPPSSSVPLDEASPYYGCRNVAFWLADEKKFLVHTGDKLAINKAFLTVFQNSTKNQWEQVHLMGGTGNAESARQVWKCGLLLVQLYLICVKLFRCLKPGHHHQKHWQAGRVWKHQKKRRGHASAKSSSLHSRSTQLQTQCTASRRS